MHLKLSWIVSASLFKGLLVIHIVLKMKVSAFLNYN